jgi:hypothetical protein
MTVAQKIEISRNIVVEIIHDELAAAPDRYTDVPVYLVHFHRQFFTCPAEVPFHTGAGFSTWLEDVDLDEWVVFFVDSYIHSGVRLALSGSLEAARMPDRRWDVSQCGAVLIRKDPKFWGEQMDEEGYFARDNKVTWEAVAEGHVSTWNTYLSEEVYGYRVVKKEPCCTCGHVDEEILDSCWGFYGLDNVRAEALASAKVYIKEEE